MTVGFAMRLLRPVLMVCTCVCLAALAGTASLAAGAAQPGCVTTAPTTELSQPEHEETDQWVEEAFTKARAAEGCNVPLKLPAGYDQMTQAQKIFWLINNEREIRGDPPFKQDTTLAQQIAYNHSKEEAVYSYTGHYSPINVPVPAGSTTNLLLREDIIPIAKNKKWGIGEVIDWGPGVASNVLFWIYEDHKGANNWEHRGLLLNPELSPEGSYLGVGYYKGGPYGGYDTVDMLTPMKPLNLEGAPITNFPPEQQAEVAEAVAPPTPYTPPPTADTEPPVVGQLSYSNGTATVTGVTDNPKNINDTGASPLVPAMSGVVFYTNNIVGPPGGAFAPGGFNTVSAKETAPGTWSAPMTVNAGEVLHAVAVDGSGNFTDVSNAPPAMALTAGENTMALPAATPATPAPEEEGAEAAAFAREAAANGKPLAAPRSAAALVKSVDKRAHGKIAQWVRVYNDGRWKTYRPGHSANFPLYVGEGVVLKLKRRVSWRPPAGEELNKPMAIKLHRGWNFVAVPYPTTGMTCHAVRLELAKQGDRMLQITVGPNPQHGVFMKPHNGKWGNDLKKRIPYGKGFWVHDEGSATWTPSPTGYLAPKIASNPVAYLRHPQTRP